MKYTSFEALKKATEQPNQSEEAQQEALQRHQAFEEALATLRKHIIRKEQKKSNAKRST